jgi:hypothetical protein
MLADYYQRSAVAAAQVLAGFDENWFKERLGSTPVGVSLGRDATSAQGAALADLVVRLLARLYPAITVVGEAQHVEPLVALAQRINPRIDVVEDAQIGIVVGHAAPFAESVFAGCDGWDALISRDTPQPVTSGVGPFGAGTAACLAAASLFRTLFDPKAAIDEPAVRFSALQGDVVASAAQAPEPPWAFKDDAVLVGAGAIGEAALWALTRAPLQGRLHVVDAEVVELSNLQRYVLTERVDEGRVKVDLAASFASVRVPNEGLEVVPHFGDLANFLMDRGYCWDAMALAVDSARDRVAAQASLPRAVVNAWTQPGDLGVSAHSRFGGPGGCVSCLYLPGGPRRNEDELIAQALGVPQFQLQVRAMLATGEPVGRNLLEAIAQSVGQPVERLMPFEQRTVRELYVEGFCGGAVIPAGVAGRLHTDAQEVHVPLAHQSALAGVLLAAALVRRAIVGDEDVTQVTRLDVLRPVGQYLRQPLRALRDGRCLCDDRDFVDAYMNKYVTPGRQGTSSTIASS